MKTTNPAGHTGAVRVLLLGGRGNAKMGRFWQEGVRGGTRTGEGGPRYAAGPPENRRGRHDHLRPSQLLRGRGVDGAGRGSISVKGAGKQHLLHHDLYFPNGGQKYLLVFVKYACFNLSRRPVSNQFIYAVGQLNSAWWENTREDRRMAKKGTTKGGEKAVKRKQKDYQLGLEVLLNATGWWGWAARWLGTGRFNIQTSSGSQPSEMLSCWAALHGHLPSPWQQPMLSKQRRKKQNKWTNMVEKQSLDPALLQMLPGSSIIKQFGQETGHYSWISFFC